MAEVSRLTRNAQSELNLKNSNKTIRKLQTKHLNESLIFLEFTWVSTDFERKIFYVIVTYKKL